MKFHVHVWVDPAEIFAHQTRGINQCAGKLLLSSRNCQQDSSNADGDTYERNKYLQRSKES